MASPKQSDDFSLQNKLDIIIRSSEKQIVQRPYVRKAKLIKKSKKSSERRKTADQEIDLKKEEEMIDGLALVLLNSNHKEQRVESKQEMTRSEQKKQSPLVMKSL